MNVREIESAITKLPASEVAQLVEWFEQFHAQMWDNQIENDVKAGRFDSLLEEAALDSDSGRWNSL